MKILIYHSFSKVKDYRDEKNMITAIQSQNDRFCLSIDVFRLQLEMMKKKKNILVTIDDGYKDFYEIAYPFIKKYKIKCILFLVVGKIGGVNDWDDTKLKIQNSKCKMSGKQLLSWDEIAEIHKEGVEIGSHSMTHSDLKTLDDKTLEWEVGESKKILEEKLNREIEYFAYPWGQFDSRVIDAVKNAGYKYAMAGNSSILEGIGNPYRLRRIEMRGDDASYLWKAKINGLYDMKFIWEFPRLCLEKIWRKNQKSKIKYQNDNAKFQS